jgi:excisionase family DNA binding protein
MVFVVALPEKSRDRAIVGGKPIQYQQAADLSHAVLPLLQWLAGAFVPASLTDTHAATGSHDIDPLQELHSKIDALRAELAEVKQLLTAERGEVVKEAYTVEEVAERTGLSEYTIREEGCNKGRIEGAFKGRDRKWRIPHATLMDLLTNGLPPK